MPEISQNEVLVKLNEIFSDQLDYPSLSLSLSDTPDTVADWDSLAQIRIMAAIEQEYGFQFDLEQLDQLYSVKAICDAIAANVQA
jgi:acyl carrier protein